MTDCKHPIILNESINKSGVKLSNHKWYLITNNIQESKGRWFIKYSAMI